MELVIQCSNALVPQGKLKLLVSEDETLAGLKVKIFKEIAMQPGHQLLTCEGQLLLQDMGTLCSQGVDLRCANKVVNLSLQSPRRSPDLLLQVRVLLPDGSFECVDLPGGAGTLWTVADGKRWLRLKGRAPRPEEQSLQALGSSWSLSDDVELLSEFSEGQVWLECVFEPAAEVFRKIRAGFCVEGPRREDVANLQKTLENSLIKLAEEINSKVSNFVFELLQNADDNWYDKGTLPTLRFTVGEDYVATTNNEKGFSLDDIKALCNVNASTKKERDDATGEKGLGFKSVFRYTSSPHLSSNSFNFKFMEKSKEHMLGYIVPHEVAISDFKHYQPDQTCLYLPASDPKPEQQRHLIDGVVPCVLLFLRRLRRVEVLQHGRLRTMLRRELGPSEVQICEQVEEDVAEAAAGSQASKEHRFLLWTRNIKLDDAGQLEKRRSHCKGTRLTLAFPRERERGHPVLQEGADVFAFLPVRRVGFGFLVQADWILVASREDLDYDNAWNKRLRDEIPAAFLEAVRSHFLPDPSLEKTYFSYLQHCSSELSPTKFFGKAMKGILSSMRSEHCVLGEHGSCLPPGSLGRLRLPKQQVLPNANCRGLISAEVLHKRLNLDYVHPDIDLSQHREILKELGCQEASLELFLPCLDLEFCEEVGFSAVFDYMKQCLDSEFLGSMDELRKVAGDARIFPLRPIGSGRALALSEIGVRQPLLFSSSEDFDALLEQMEQHVLGVNLYGEARLFVERAGALPVVPWEIIQHQILPRYQRADRWHWAAELRHRKAEVVRTVWADWCFLRLTLEQHPMHEQKKNILRSCAEHMVVGTNWTVIPSCSVGEASDDNVQGFAHISDCCLRSEELEQVFSGWEGAKVPNGIQFLSQLFLQPATSSESCETAKHAWLHLYKQLGASQALPLVEKQEDFCFSLEEKKKFRALPFARKPQWPLTFFRYTVSWPAFDPSVEAYLQEDFGNWAPEAVRLSLLRLLARCWEDEYQPRLNLTVRYYHKDHKRPCQHRRTECSEPECSRTLGHPTSPSDLQHLPFLQQLRQLKVPTSDGLRSLSSAYHRDVQLMEVFGESVPWLPELLESQNFLRSCGVSVEVDVDVNLKWLREVSQQPEKMNNDQLVRLHRCYFMLAQLAKNCNTQASKVREAFHNTEQRLYLCSWPSFRHSPEQTGQWLSHKDVRWDGPVGIFEGSLGFLAPVHKHKDLLRLFFVDTLRVRTSPVPEDYVDRLRQLQALCPRRQEEIQCFFRDKLLPLYQQVSKQIEANPWSAESDFKAFREEKLFLTDAGWWSKASDILIDDDHKNELRQKLRHSQQLQFLAKARVRGEISSIDGLLRFSQANLLSEVVQVRPETKTCGVLSKIWTERIRELVLSVLRLMQVRKKHLWEDKHKVIDWGRWAKLVQSVEVRIVPSLYVQSFVWNVEAGADKKDVAAVDYDTPTLMVDGRVQLDSEEFLETAAPEIARFFCKPCLWPDLGELVYSILQRLVRSSNDLERTLQRVYRLPPMDEELKRLRESPAEGQENDLPDEESAWTGQWQQCQWDQQGWWQEQGTEHPQEWRHEEDQMQPVWSQQQAPQQHWREEGDGTPPPPVQEGGYHRCQQQQAWECEDKSDAEARFDDGDQELRCAGWADTSQWQQQCNQEQLQSSHQFENWQPYEQISDQTGQQQAHGQQHESRTGNTESAREEMAAMAVPEEVEEESETEADEDHNKEKEEGEKEEKEKEKEVEEVDGGGRLASKQQHPQVWQQQQPWQREGQFMQPQQDPDKVYENTWNQQWDGQGDTVQQQDQGQEQKLEQEQEPYKKEETQQEQEQETPEEEHQPELDPEQRQSVLGSGRDQARNHELYQQCEQDNQHDRGHRPEQEKEIEQEQQQEQEQEKEQEWDNGRKQRSEAGLTDSEHGAAAASSILAQDGSLPESASSTTADNACGQQKPWEPRSVGRSNSATAVFREVVPDGSAVGQPAATGPSAQQREEEVELVKSEQYDEPKKATVGVQLSCEARAELPPAPSGPPVSYGPPSTGHVPPPPPVPSEKRHESTEVRSSRPSLDSDACAEPFLFAGGLAAGPVPEGRKPVGEESKRIPGHGPLPSSPHRLGPEALEDVPQELWELRQVRPGGARRGDPSSLHGILLQIFAENSGHEVFVQGAGRILHERRRVESVRNIRYSHDRISKRFSHGLHAGQKVEDLAAALDRGEVCALSCPELQLRVVRFGSSHGGSSQGPPLHSMYNRRLKALKLHQEHEDQRTGGSKYVMVNIIEYDLDPITAKFAMAYTTKDQGLSVEFYENPTDETSEQQQQQQQQPPPLLHGIASSPDAAAPEQRFDVPQQQQQQQQQRQQQQQQPAYDRRVAEHDWSEKNPEEGYLPVRRGDLVHILHVGSAQEEGWVFGAIGLQRGWVPNHALGIQPCGSIEV